MRINTTRFGMQDIDPDTVLHFPKGLPGFEACTRFKLFHEEKESPVVFWLQALDDADVLFSVIDPTVLGFHYELPLSDDESSLLRLDQAGDVAVLLMLSRTAPGETGESGIRPNIAAPILVNTRARVGFQKPISDLAYSITFRTPQTNRGS